MPATTTDVRAGTNSDDLKKFLIRLLPSLELMMAASTIGMGTRITSVSTM